MKLNNYNLFILLVIVVFSSSCDILKMKDDSDQAVTSTVAVARVKDKKLYLDDLKGIVPSGTVAADSTYIIEKFIDKWVRQQLLIAEAESKVQINEAELKRKLDDLKFELMIHEYHKFYINEELNTDITADEVQKYYNENMDNFILKQNIIKGFFIKIPKEAPKIATLQRLVKSTKASDMEELKSYCYRFATTYSLEDSVWLNFDEVIANTPLIGIPNKVQYLKNNRFVESSDDNYLYYLKIKEYKIADQYSPVEVVDEQIRAIIKNKRKVALIAELEEEIYRKAVANHEFEIYK